MATCHKAHRFTSCPLAQSGQASRRGRPPLDQQEKKKKKSRSQAHNFQILGRRSRGTNFSIVVKTLGHHARQSTSSSSSSSPMLLHHLHQLLLHTPVGAAACLLLAAGLGVPSDWHCSVNEATSEGKACPRSSVCRSQPARSCRRCKGACVPSFPRRARREPQNAVITAIVQRPAREDHGSREAEDIGPPTVGTVLSCPTTPVSCLAPRAFSVPPTRPFAWPDRRLNRPNLNLFVLVYLMRRPCWRFLLPTDSNVLAIRIIQR